METTPFDAYVRETLALQGYRFDDARIADIEMQFSRFAAMAHILFDVKLPLDAEGASVFRP